GSHHSHAAVSNLFHIFAGDRPEVAGPAGAGVKLGVGTKNLVATGGTAIDALFVVIIILTAEGRLGSFLAKHKILLRRELLFPLGIRFIDLVGLLGFLG